jgi:hypothetical protein
MAPLVFGGSNGFAEGWGCGIYPVGLQFAPIIRPVCLCAKFPTDEAVLLAKRLLTF